MDSQIPTLPAGGQGDLGRLLGGRPQSRPVLVDHAYAPIRCDDALEVRLTFLARGALIVAELDYRHVR